MLLGIALHAAIAYSGGPWIARDDASAACGIACLAIHGFRMQLFFLLSGFFAAMLWRRRGLRGLLSNRSKRIALPLVVGVFTIVPLVWLVVWWAIAVGAGEAPGERAATTMMSSGEISSSDVGAAATPGAGQSSDVASTRERGPIAVALAMLFKIPVFHHLWFLWFLCWLLAGFALVVAALGTPVAAPVRRGLARMRRRFGMLVGSGLALAWLVPLTVATFALMDLTREAPNFGADTSTGILPMPGVLAHYAVFFAFGVLLFEVPGALSGFTRRWWIALPLAVVLFPIAAGFAFGATVTHSIVANDAAHRAIAWTGPALYAWLMSIGLLGLFARTMPAENRVVRYMSDSSYWMYLAHLPLVVAGQIAMRGVPWPPLAKFAVLSIGATALLLASYEWCVRRTWIGLLLNGKRG